MSRPPVRDWAADFDHTDPRWVEDPYPIWRELRGSCPVAHTSRFQDGVWFPTRHADVRAVAYDHEHFSSRRVVVREKKLEPPHPAPPITSDPPEHRPARTPLLRPFGPKAVERLRPAVRETCRELLSAFAARGSCDAAAEYAQHVPTRVMAHLLGVPAEDGELFRTWIRQALEQGIHDPKLALAALRAIDAYFREKVTSYAGSGDDLVGHLLAEGLPPESAVATLRLLMIAGIDTTWSAIGASLWHLATHADDRRRLVAEPELMDTAVEELLRAYAPVTMAREVVKEVELGDRTLTPGSMVLLSFPAANRDPEVFPDPDRVVLDRAVNPHVAFGLGIHRCIGSNLARMELRVALEEWLAQIPEFRLEEATPDGEPAVTWAEGTVRGPRRLRVVFP